MIDLSAYKGRWVALDGDEVIAAGFSAVETYRMALQTDPSEHFLLDYVTEVADERLPLPALLEKVQPLLTGDAFPVYLVGGVVRDALLDRESHDLDFVCARRAIDVTFQVADALHAPAFVLDDARDTGRIVLPDEGTTLDFAGYRGSDLLADLADRDFTINALAMPVAARTRQGVIDPTGGVADLAARRLRQANPAAVQRDPVRALRAVRLASELGLTMTPETEEAVRAAREDLATVSAERVRDELLKMVRSRTAAEAFGSLQELGLLAAVLPELSGLAEVAQSAPHHEPVLAHSLSVLRWLDALDTALFADAVPEEEALADARRILAPVLSSLDGHLSRLLDGGLDGRTILRLAAVFHDAGKRATVTVDMEGHIRFFGHAEIGAEMIMPRLKQLCLSNEAIFEIRRIVAQHMRPLLLVQAQGARPTRRATYRYFKEAGHNGLDVGLLALADHLATYNGPGDREAWLALLQLVAALFDDYTQRHDETVKPPALVNGRELMAYLALPPGPEIGRLLRLIEENQAAGEITTREEALRFAAGQYAEDGGASG